MSFLPRRSRAPAAGTFAVYLYDRQARWICSRGYPKKPSPTCHTPQDESFLDT